MITTTLNRIARTSYFGRQAWGKLLKGLGKAEADDEPFPFARIVEINGLRDALWCCEAEPQYAPEWRLFAVWCARRVKMKYKRSIKNLDVVERYVNGDATDFQLLVARATLWQSKEPNYRAWAALQWASVPVTYAAEAEPLWRTVTMPPTELAAQTEEFLRIVNETEART